MKKPLFVISSPFDTYSGYGARARDVIKSIIQSDKYEVQLLSQRWGNTPWGFVKDHEEEWGFLLNHLLQPQQQNPKPDIWMQITVPNEFQPYGKYNIGMTAGMETTLVDGTWVEGINRMDINFVSSEHSKQAFLNSVFQKQEQGRIVGEVKVQKPIEVLFEGIDLDTYFPDNSPCLIDFNIPESFAYLFVGHWMQGNLGEDRKNVGYLIKSFLETFKNTKNPPALILKTSGSGASYMDRAAILKRYYAIRKTVKGKLPNIYILHGEFTNKEMNSLYNHSKVKAMVCLTKGEGFGRPLLEFTQSKKPIIVSAWSGHMDFLHPEYNVFINGKLKNVDKSAVVANMILPESQWFTPNHSEVGTAFKNVHKDYKKYSELGKRQAHYSKSNFSWDKMHEKLSDYLDKNIPTFAQQVELKLPDLGLKTPSKLELPKLK
jgi:glycosyltransferase involved in cell wall biosynthesis